MIEPHDYGEVRWFRMARTLLGRAFYWTGGHFSKRNFVRAFLRA